MDRLRARGFGVRGKKARRRVFGLRGRPGTGAVPVGPRLFPCRRRRRLARVAARAHLALGARARGVRRRRDCLERALGLHKRRHGGFVLGEDRRLVLRERRRRRRRRRHRLGGRVVGRNSSGRSARAPEVRFHIERLRLGPPEGVRVLVVARVDGSVVRARAGARRSRARVNRVNRVNLLRRRAFAERVASRSGVPRRDTGVRRGGQTLRVEARARAPR